ncbi:MAG: hypothetical protein U1F43_36270 [Myxococcota bacterium]
MRLLTTLAAVAATPVFASAAALGFVACDSSASPDPDKTTPETAGDPSLEGPMLPLPPEPGQQLASLPYTLEGGDERYFCYTFTSPDEAVGITHVQNLAGKLVHHVVVFQSLVPEPEGFSECNVLFKPTWVPIWLAAKGSEGMQLPDGVTFKVAPHTQYVLQYHLLNARPTAVTERSGINLTYATDLAQYQTASAMIVGSLALDIPKDALGFTQTNECISDRPLNVFAVLPHMHLLGKRLDFFTGPPDDVKPVYSINPWNFDDQPFVPMSLTIQPGDVLRARCTWDNTTGKDVGFGESTYDEMCMFLVYAWPMSSIATCGL